MKKSDFEYSQFTKDRYLFIFMAGTYEKIDIIINYYTSFLGGGANKNDVILNNSTVKIPTFMRDPTLGALDNFWRSLENMTIHFLPDTDAKVRSFEWSASQASLLRSVHITGGSQPDNSIWFFSLTTNLLPKVCTRPVVM
jgi:hypothetical protein